MNEKEYHKARRMFFLISDELVIPEKGSDKSHREWLIENGHTQEKAETIIETVMRGVVNPNGNLRFYTGEDFKINKKIEKEFFEILPELIEKFNIRMDSEIEGGTLRQKNGKFWPARKKYGKVEDFIKK